MDDLKKPDPAEAWLIAEKLLADEELERLDAMSDEEVLAEVRASGIEVPSVESLMAGARAKLERGRGARATKEEIAALLRESAEKALARGDVKGCREKIEELRKVRGRKRG